MLQCPNCHLALRAHIQDDVEIDICDECQGVWLDAGELEILSNGKEFAPHQGAEQAVPSLRCPRCDTQQFHIIAMEEGRLTQCSDCHGVFVEGRTIEFLALRKGARGDTPGPGAFGEFSRDAAYGVWYFDLVAGFLGGFS